MLRRRKVPLVPFTFAAVLWDQGEADEGNPWYKNNTIGNSSNTEASADYAKEFPELISEWRTAFKMPTANTSNTSQFSPSSPPPPLPGSEKGADTVGGKRISSNSDARSGTTIHTAAARVVPFVYVEMDSASYAFWLAQRAAITLADVGFATTVDIEQGLHPPDKDAVAQRLVWEIQRIGGLAGTAATAPSKPSILSITSVASSAKNSTKKKPADRLNKGTGPNHAPPPPPPSTVNVVFTFNQPVASHTSSTGYVPNKGAQCGAARPAGQLDSTIISMNRALVNYTLSAAGTVLTATCRSPNDVLSIASARSGCFLYNAAGLPLAPICVLCNDTAAVCKAGIH